jgi:hypothetical protein
MKAKLLEFAFIYFYESGLFNGSQRFQIKESGLVSSSAPNVSNPLIQLFFSFSSPSARLPGAGFDFPNGKTVALISGLRNKL